MISKVKWKNKHAGIFRDSELGWMRKFALPQMYYEAIIYIYVILSNFYYKMYYKAVETFLMCCCVGIKIRSMEQNRDLN